MNISELRYIQPGSPLIIEHIAGIGITIFIGCRIASFRRDVVKLKVCRIVGTECNEEVVHESPEREILTEDGKTYVIRQPRSDRERESALRILARYKDVE